MGFLRERFSKSVENDNYSRIIYRNDDIARLVKTVIMRKMLIHDRTSLRSPALSQVYLSLTFQFSQTAVVTFEMNSTFWTVPVKLNSYNFSKKN